MAGINSRLTAKSIVDITSGVAMIVASAFIVWNIAGQRTPAKREAIEVPSQPVPVDVGAMLGSATAKVGLVVFSDFECPFCAKFASEVLPALKRKVVDRGFVRVAFKHDPLSKIHPLADRAAIAAECGRTQALFWPMHDELFSTPKRLEEDSLLVHARKAGLDGVQFSRCMEAGKRDQIESDLQLVKTLKVGSTPTFFIGPIEGDAVRVKAVIQGAQPIDEFLKVIDTVVGKGS